MKEIKEVIVVEGHHDTEKLQKYFHCDTIETSGTHLGKDVINLIKRAQEKRGVIIFTDPDSPGNRIRHIINQQVPGCKNAYIDKELAHTKHKVGVEHADEEALTNALSHLITNDPHIIQRITIQDLYELGLTGNQDSAQLRKKMGQYFHIGDGSAKTMCHRLNLLAITKEELTQWMKSNI